MLFILKILLLGLGYASAVVAGLGCLVMFGVYILGRTRGVTWEERRLGVKGVIAFIVGMFVSIAFFGGAQWIQWGHDQAAIDAARALMGECGQLGDARPLPAPGKVLIWDAQSDQASKANEGLRKDLRAGWNDDMLVFLVGNDRQLSGPPFGYVIDVWVVRWPQKEAQGKYTVRKDQAPDPILEMKAGRPNLSGVEAAIVQWIHGLPARARGDGPELKLARPETERPPGKKEGGVGS
jgi:hypothetical protein